MRHILLLGLIFCVSLFCTANAATVTGRSGLVTTAQATTGASDNVVSCPGTPGSGIVFDITETGTTTVVIEHSSDNTNWTAAAVNGTTKLSFADPTNIGVHITPCAGLYRTNATTCTTCSLTVTYVRTDP